ncbi:MAG TPA: YkgJ family cysteine cluster protein [Rhizomicrobium sp.]|nr:YkgJ family cysteine cluster protein [Rhizomicrobium sp.]
MLSDSERAMQARQDASLLPLPLRAGGNPRLMAAHLRQVVQRLKGKSASPARDAVTYLTALYDRSVTPRGDLACAKGCAFCCAQTVIVTAAEAFAVAAEMRERQDMVAGVLAGPRRQLGEPKSAWRPCPFLGEDKACAVYEARPLACHAFVSFDLQTCVDFFSGNSDRMNFTPGDRQQLLYASRMMLHAAHQLAGHGPQPGHELGSAVAAILKTPDAEARWRKGENILKEVPLGPPIPAAVTQEIARIVEFVRPTL